MGGEGERTELIDDIATQETRRAEDGGNDARDGRATTLSGNIEDRALQERSLAIE